MKKYKNTSPSFLDEIDIMERTDPVDAETVSTIPLKQLHDNTAANHGLIKTLTIRVQQLEDLIRRLFAFSYDETTETIYTNDEGVEYDSDTETITLPDELAAYTDEDETITLSGGTGGGGGGSVYILPTATATRLGGVRIGENVNVESDGTISVDTDETASAAADIVEQNATQPSDSDIDGLFETT